MPNCEIIGCSNRTFKKSAKQLKYEKEYGRITFHRLVISSLEAD